MHVLVVSLAVGVEMGSTRAPLRAAPPRGASRPSASNAASVVRVRVRVRVRTGTGTVFIIDRVASRRVKVSREDLLFDGVRGAPVAGASRARDDAR